MNPWQLAKWSLLTVVVLALGLGLARLFSGPEDTWVRDESGAWVAHGRPAGPPPAPEYRAPLAERALPWAILGVSALGLIGGALLSRRRPVSQAALARDVRFFGTVSVAAAALLSATAAGLVVTVLISAGHARTLSTGEGAITAIALACLAGLLAFLALVALQAYGVRRVLEANYELRRAAALLQDTVERLQGG